MKKWIASIVFTMIFQLIFMSQVAVAQKADWLIKPIAQKASIVIKNNTLIIDNCLVRRTF